MILVTDANGTVTGLYNYRDSRLNTVDTTPDPRVDDTTEVIALATQAYLAANTRQAAGSQKIASSLNTDLKTVVPGWWWIPSMRNQHHGWSGGSP